MFVKRLLLFIPLVLVFLLVQSYFWVPTYENQAAGNPDRLVTYIEGSSGDAKILNPILNADSSSSAIVSQVFEGLLDLDENLALRGRLATDWQITERAFLAVNPHQRFPDGTEVTGARLFQKIHEAWEAGTEEGLKDYVQSLELLPAIQREETISLLLPNAEGRPQLKDVPVTVKVPERVAFTLSQVDQDLFDRLKPILGEQYFDHFPYDEMIYSLNELTKETEETLREKFPEILPIGEHNPTIVFHLRKGVKFQDGHEFDAGDVKFTYEAIMNPKNLSPRTPDFEPIKTVEIIDLYTVKIIYKRLYSPAINAWTMGILPEHLLNDESLTREKQERGLSEEAQKTFGMRDSRFNRHPIGSGRFQFVEWQGDEFIHLNRFDEYWEDPAQYHDYFMRIIPELFTQEVEFRTGAIDFYGAQPHQVDRYKNDPTYQWFSSLGFAYTYIGYNNRKPLFGNAEIRRALGMAINVDEIIQYLMYGEGERTTGPYPKNTEWYDPSIQPLPYDPQGAQSIFQKHGWKVNGDGWLEKNGKIFEFNLITNNGNPIRKNLMTIAQNAWKKIGVKVNTQVFEWAVFLGDFVNTGDFDAVVLGWSMGIDPDLYQIWHSSQAGPQQLNFVGYKSQRADELIVRIRQEYNRDRQRQLTHKLHQLIHEDQPYTFLYAPLSTRVLDKKIVLVQKGADGKEEYQKIYPIKSGDITFHFHKWRKLEFTPDF
ncbi:MAG: peptide ABC transporter substrate-binding protein [Nitrospirota bacterium]|nr:MAG: peptide ABC transporter substrate-binding protein [Nitrospirota bacterium]